jgi:predicted nucleic acid-binding protein
VIYLDSSALVKLALTGPESAELADWLAERNGQPLVSSVLHRAEVPRAVWQAEPGALPRSYKVIKRIARVALSPDMLDDSATLPPQDLSPAQAIHLASALAVKRDLTAFVSYDEPLLAAARDVGLPVASPGGGGGLEGGGFGVGAPFGAEGAADLAEGGFGAGGVQHGRDQVRLGARGGDQGG